MTKKFLAAAATFMMLAPMLGLLSIGVLVNPAVLNQGNCIASGVVLGPIPDSLEVTMKDRYTFTLNRQTAHPRRNHHHRRPPASPGWGGTGF